MTVGLLSIGDELLRGEVANTNAQWIASQLSSIGFDVAAIHTVGDNHKALVAGLEKLGLGMLVDPASRLPMLNAVSVPGGVDEAAVRSALRTEHKIEIGAGLGPLAGKIWRIGLMGHTARPESVNRLLDALKQILR